MARGRNAGFRRLLERMPELELVQFLDGDCELQPGWLEQGRLRDAGATRMRRSCPGGAGSGTATPTSTTA